MRALGLLSLALAACAADPNEWKIAYMPAGTAWTKVAQDFTFNNGTEPQTLDPGIMTGVPESRLALALFEGLVTLDPETLEPRPGVAESWEISADGQTYTFHLRDNARWSDGRAVTATDFVRSWRRVLEPKTGASYAGQLFPIAHAEEFHRGTIADFSKVGAAAVDERTLRVVLKQPCAYFLELAAFHTLMPVPVDLIAQYGDRWVRPELIVGNGPYRLQKWEPRQAIEFSKNEYYWDANFCKLAKITALPYDDAEAAYKLYQDGQLDWLPGLPQLKLAEIARNPDYYVAPYLGTYFYRFNARSAPFDSANVRRAFALAVDRREITDQILKGGEQPAGTICPSIGGYDPGGGLMYNRDQARRLLASAGYGMDKPFPAVELLFNTSERHKQIAEAVAQQWKTVLGVTVSLRNSEWKSYLSDVDNGHFQIARASWIGDYNDPNTFFDLWMTDGGNNRTGWSSAEYDRLLNASQRELDQAKRVALFHAMDRILSDECPVIPIYRYVNQGLLRQSVNGLRDNLRDHHPYQYMWME